MKDIDIIFFWIIGCLAVLVWSFVIYFGLSLNEINNRYNEVDPAPHNLEKYDPWKWERESLSND